MHPIEFLPDHLAERTRSIEAAVANSAEGGDPVGGGRPVLWWVHHAMRVEENPAFDVACELAHRLEVPLLAVAVVGGRHRFNNDRHATFALEGLRDLQGGLRKRGLDLAVLVRQPGEPSVVGPLAREASAVVTEEMPAAPWPAWLEAIAASTSAPVYAVDAACVVPMSLSRKAPDRAFVFRDRLAGERRGRLVATWPDGRTGVESSTLPKGSLDLADADDAQIAAIVGALDIDHSIGPVFDTPGGTDAGLRRWTAFRSHGLKRYGRDRNDAARDGVSRMSAYLHYGMVSPFRIARDACHDRAEKYLDELLIWRELAWHWAARRPEHESVEVLPRWSQETLADHRNDPRDRLDDETLERGTTGETLWDLAQRSLRWQGELHNNVRMTWGKAIPLWSKSPDEAIRRLFDLNNRHALDGCDPSSAGGLLWCLGLFDRPFQPEQPVLGAVRGRDPADHASRLDVAGYERRVSRLQRRGAAGGPLRVAVVGAGICGLASARTLADHGVAVRVFDKARGPGGRISTRRGSGGRFDHGASSFTVRDPRFGRFVRAWRDVGVVERWDAQLVRCDEVGRVVERRSLADDGEFVGVGGMNRIAKHLASDLDLSCGSKVERLEREQGGGWTVHIEDRAPSSGWDAVIVTTPGPQAGALLDASGVDVDEALGVGDLGRATAPAWVAMIELTRPLETRFGRLESAGKSSWCSIVDQGSKPGRDETPGVAFVLEASEAWTTVHLEDDRDTVAGALSAMFVDAVGGLGGEAIEIASCVAHRWRYARPSGMRVEPSAVAIATVPKVSTHEGVLFGGDYARAGSVEGAWLAGLDLAGAVLREARWAVRDSSEAGVPPAGESMLF